MPRFLGLQQDQPSWVLRTRPQHLLVWATCATCATCDLPASASWPTRCPPSLASGNGLTSYWRGLSWYLVISRLMNPDESTLDPESGQAPVTRPWELRSGLNTAQVALGGDFL